MRTRNRGRCGGRVRRQLKCTHSAELIPQMSVCPFSETFPNLRWRSMAFLSTFVGFGKHRGPNIRDLIGCTRDATALHALFADTFPETKAKLLIDHDATLANIQSAIKETRRVCSFKTDQPS